MIPEDKINYYREPVEIEIYLKKAGKIKTIVKNLYIELIDIDPDIDPGKRIFEYFSQKEEPIDLVEAQNLFPEIIMPVNDSYYQYIDLYEKLSLHIKGGLNGSDDSWKLALYMTEQLMKYEPTVASLEFIGDFSTYNLNYFIRKLNRSEVEFLLEDKTVAYLIKRHRQNQPEDIPDPEFDKLVELWEYNIKEKFI